MENEQTFEIEEVDVEECLKRDERVPNARRYIIRIDKQREISHHAIITGTEILALVHKTPEKYKLYQHKRGHQPSLIGPQEAVDLAKHGIERFTTMAKDTTEGLEGSAAVRRQFQPLAGDSLYLDRLGLRWEAINDNGTHWLLLEGWTPPSGYNCGTVSIGLLIPPNYPDTQIDMVYFLPALHRLDGKQIGALSTQAIAGEIWQRWSRHRTVENPWRPDQDDVASHLGLVDEWLRREFVNL
jgi:Prokaryotic E2 family E/Multiubiquitin